MTGCCFLLLLAAQFHAWSWLGGLAFAPKGFVAFLLPAFLSGRDQE